MRAVNLFLFSYLCRCSTLICLCAFLGSCGSFLPTDDDCSGSVHPDNSGCESKSAKGSEGNSREPFVETGGLLVVELESTTYPAAWALKQHAAASGGHYLEFSLEDDWGKPGRAVINIPIHIANPGKYRFEWRNNINMGDSPTDANDSWLRIDAPRFYAEKENAIVCPKGFDKTLNNCEGEPPEGAGAGGWFKVWRTGTPVGDFLWSTFTNDNNGHKIFVEFGKAGRYTVQISGRSKFHGIDRLVLYRDGNSDKNVEQAFAISLDRTESAQFRQK